MDAKQTFLAAYDYGQGGLWCLIDARSKDEIAAKYPQLKVLDAQPAWMTPQEYDRIASDMHVDLDEEPRGWLRKLAERKGG